MSGTRTIYHADALKWLQDQPVLQGCSIVTSLPDISEFPQMSVRDWKIWFQSAAELVLSKAADDGLVIFYQSDIKREGQWIDKGFLCQKAAEKTGHQLVAHKIVCRAPAGTLTKGRPSYSRLLCFSKNIRISDEVRSADVLPRSGVVTWKRGMGTEACRTACEMILAHTNTTTVVDPFCGHGTVLAVANQMGLNSVGVDLSLKNSTIAQQLNFPTIV